MFAIYDSDLSPLGLIENYSSMQWTRRYTKAGQFELHAPLSSLFVPENVIKNGSEAGVIESVAISSTESGVMAEVRGRTLLSYLSRRIIWGLIAATGTAENIMRSIVTSNLRGLPLTVASAVGYAGTIDYQNSYGNVLAEVEAIAEMAQMGVRMDFDRVFRVYKGLDRTPSQSVNSRAVFSRDFENVLDSEYFLDQSAYKNVALVAGQGEMSNRLLVTVGDATGLNRREVFVDARDIGGGTASEPISVAAQQAMLTTKGQQTMAEMKASESFSATVDPCGNLKYKTDYDLGDIVTVIDIGMRTDARITEIKEVYENGGLQLELTLGYERVIKLG